MFKISSRLLELFVLKKEKEASFDACEGIIEKALNNQKI